MGEGSQDSASASAFSHQRLSTSSSSQLKKKKKIESRGNFLLLLHLNKIKEILNKIKEIMQRWTKVGVGGRKKIFQRDQPTSGLSNWICSTMFLLLLP